MNYFKKIINKFTFYSDWLILNEDLAGYSLSYRSIHGNDDRLPPQDSE